MQLTDIHQKKPGTHNGGLIIGIYYIEIRVIVNSLCNLMERWGIQMAQNTSTLVLKKRIFGLHGMFLSKDVLMDLIINMITEIDFILLPTTSCMEGNMNEDLQSLE